VDRDLRPLCPRKRTSLSVASWCQLYPSKFLKYPKIICGHLDPTQARRTPAPPKVTSRKGPPGVASLTKTSRKPRRAARHCRRAVSGRQMHGWAIGGPRGPVQGPVALLEDMRTKTKDRVAKTRAKARGVLRNTIPETPDVRARVALDAMKDEAAVDLIKAQPMPLKTGDADMAPSSASRRHRR
jgi:hypothetical protein